VEGRLIRIFCGYDPREAVGYHCCSESIIKNSSLPVSITPLYLPQLQRYAESHTDGSNQFIYSRFLVPWLCNYEGWAIWLDGDMIVKDDIVELWEMRDQEKAVQVVKHDYKTKFPDKYLGNKNQDYPRKNWSSVILWNCSHLSLRGLTPELIQESPGSFLHRFSWIPDEQIGELPKTWNWLVEEYEHNDDAKLLHFTVGIPAFSEYVRCDHSKDWWNAYKGMTYCEQRIYTKA
jgi:lipopolysaccharide biosynthesis glycosyltransferase